MKKTIVVIANLAISAIALIYLLHTTHPHILTYKDVILLAIAGIFVAHAANAIFGLTDPDDNFAVLGFGLLIDTGRMIIGEIKYMRCQYRYRSNQAKINEFKAKQAQLDAARKNLETKKQELLLSEESN